jgi:hypothetical protein
VLEFIDLICYKTREFRALTRPFLPLPFSVLFTLSCEYNDHRIKLSLCSKQLSGASGVGPEFIMDWSYVSYDHRDLEHLCWFEEVDANRLFLF